MRRRSYLMAASLLAIAVSAPAQEVRPVAAEDVLQGQSPDGRRLEIPQLMSDFALFRSALEEAHPGLHRYRTPEEINSIFAAAQTKLNRPQSLLDFYNVLTGVLIAIKCGHTEAPSSLEIDGLLDRSRLFPLKLWFVAERAYVFLNLSSDPRVQPGMEVLAVNGETMGALVQRLLPYIPQDGDVTTGQMFELSRPDMRPQPRGFGRLYRLHIADPGTFRIGLRDARSNKMFDTELDGVRYSEALEDVPANPVNRKALAGFHNVALGGRTVPWVRRGLEPSVQFLQGTAVLRVPSMGMPEDRFRAFLDTTFARLKTKGTRRLVIDIRGNSGGRDLNSAILFSYLTQKEFGLFRRVHMKTFDPTFKEHAPYRWDVPEGFVRPDPAGGWLLTEKKAGVGRQLPSQPHFAGPVYVLIDGGSFSGAADFAALADYEDRATFIGEETAATAEGNSSGFTFTLTLPESRLAVRIVAYSYDNYVKRGNLRRGTLPKYTVRQTIDDLLKGRDTALDFTLKMIRRNQQQPSPDTPVLPARR